MIKNFEEYQEHKRIEKAVFNRLKKNTLLGRTHHNKSCFIGRFFHCCDRFLPQSQILNN